MNIIIDSNALGSKTPADITLYLNDKFPSHIKGVRIKSVTTACGGALYRTFQNADYVYINCDIIDRDVNLFNGEKSNILSLYFIPQGAKNISVKYEHRGFKPLKSADFTALRIYLTSSNHSVLMPIQHFSIVYELEFM